MRGIQAGCEETAEGENRLGAGERSNTQSHLTAGPPLLTAEPIHQRPLGWVQVALSAGAGLLKEAAGSTRHHGDSCWAWGVRAAANTWAGERLWSAPDGLLLRWALQVSVAVCPSRRDGGMFPQGWNSARMQTQQRGIVHWILMCSLLWLPASSSLLSSRVLISALYFHSLASGTADQLTSFSSSQLSIAFKDPAISDLWPLTSRRDFPPH